MSLEQILGEGSTQSFEDAIRLPEQTPIVSYSDWEDSPHNVMGLNISTDTAPWPGPGVWRRVNVIWNDARQEAFFQKKENKAKIVWGNGICAVDTATTNAIKRLGTPAMKLFLATYIDEMRITLPNIRDFYNPFIMVGFELIEISDHTVEAFVMIKDPDSKMAESFKWLIGGNIPEEEPVWRTQIRKEIGLNELFLR